MAYKLNQITIRTNNSKEGMKSIGWWAMFSILNLRLSNINSNL